MKKFKKKGFTLIELIAVLVIMAILALIVTPLVMNIIRKARISADRRSVDAYGRSIELAISSHLLDTGKFATSIDELTIEYSGNQVECETTQINPDSSVYLSNCKVNNRDVTNYTYGTDKSPSYEAYSVGDEVTYNGVDYYVIKDSGIKDNVVTLLKATPLTVDEVNLYGNGHINQYYKPFRDYEGFISENVSDCNGYGCIAYYTSEHCYNYDESGCSTDYLTSEIKYIIDSWESDQVKTKVKKSRLITKDEYLQMTLEETYETPTEPGKRYAPIYDWMYNSEYRYWTMSSYEDSSHEVYIIATNGDLPYYSITVACAVRPVVELYKNDGITKKNSSNN